MKMTIVISTMKNLPEHCYDCPLNNNEHLQCEADECKRYSENYRPFWCPLKEIDDGSK